MALRVCVCVPVCWCVCVCELPVPPTACFSDNRKWSSCSDIAGAVASLWIKRKKQGARQKKIDKIIRNLHAPRGAVVAPPPDSRKFIRFFPHFSASAPAFVFFFCQLLFCIPLAAIETLTMTGDSRETRECAANYRFSPWPPAFLFQFRDISLWFPNFEHYIFRYLGTFPLQPKRAEMLRKCILHFAFSMTASSFFHFWWTIILPNSQIMLMSQQKKKKIIMPLR